MADVDEQLGNELVTLLTPGGGQLLPHEVGGQGQDALLRLEMAKTLVHHSLLLVVIHKT